MTQQQAENAANLLLGAAAVGLVYYVVKTPRLRRLVWQAARAALTTTAPAWLMAEARRGWQESAHVRRPLPR